MCISVTKRKKSQCRKMRYQENSLAPVFALLSYVYTYIILIWIMTLKVFSSATTSTHTHTRFSVARGRINIWIDVATRGGGGICAVALRKFPHGQIKWHSRLKTRAPMWEDDDGGGFAIHVEAPYILSAPREFSNLNVWCWIASFVSPWHIPVRK